MFRQNFGLKIWFLGTGKRSHKVTPFYELFLTVLSCKVASLFC